MVSKHAFAGVFLVAVCAWAFGPAASPVRADGLSGGRHSIAVIDGDTLQMAGRVVQLAGIDAPELGQVCVHGGQDWPCGLRAAYALHKLIELAADPVTCTGLTELPGGIVRATCEAGTENLSLTMLRSGYAAALPDAARYYRDAEEKARAADLGLWAGGFVPPWEWRGGTRLAEEGEGDGTCPVYGKVSSDGTRLYYVPTDRQFHGMTLDATAGDQAFCSDEAARDAGWRRPGEAL